MKKPLLLSLMMLVLSLTSLAQRYAIIDSKYIMDKVPQYTEAQKTLDGYSKVWQTEIDQRQAAVDKMIKDYDAEIVMLPENLRKKREDEIFNKEKELRDLQRKRFGFEGDLPRILFSNSNLKIP